MRHEDHDDEAMPDLEDFVQPDTPRPMPRVDVSTMANGGGTMRVSRPDGRTQVVELSVQDMASLRLPIVAAEEDGDGKGKRKTTDQRKFRDMSLSDARRAQCPVIKRANGQYVRMASERVSEAIRARTTAPGMSPQMKLELAQRARTHFLNRVGIRDEPNGELRFPDPSNPEDHRKLGQQQGIITWVKADKITPDGCFAFRNNEHRGLPKGLTRIPIAGLDFDLRMKTWKGDLLNIITPLPLINIPIATPQFIGWLVDKHWPVVADSFDVISCYVCALRILIGGMDVGAKIINRNIDRLFMGEDREKSAAKLRSGGQPLWTLEPQDKAVQIRENLRKLRFPDWFDLGFGRNPTVKRNKKLSDDDLEKIMVQRAIDHQMTIRDFILTQLNTGLAQLDAGVQAIKAKNNGVVPVQTMKHFFDRIYTVCEVATYRLLSAYELTIQWVIQRHMPTKLIGKFSNVNRKVPPSMLPASFVQYVLGCRRKLFQARTYLGGPIPPERPTREEPGFQQAIIRPLDSTFPTIQEMHAFYVFLQFKTNGQQDLINRLTLLNHATKGTPPTANT